MNVHVPQSLEAQAELKYLSSVRNSFINSQNSKLNIVLVQDGVLGSYLMTKKNSRKLNRNQFFNATMRLSLTTQEVLLRMNRIQSTIQDNPTSTTTLLSGRGLVSLILPSNFDYFSPIGKEQDEKNLIIKDGVILLGCLSKKAIGSAHRCIPHMLFNEYGPDVALSFLDNLQFLANEFLLITSFSIGFKDCLKSSSANTVDDTVKKCFMEAEGVLHTTSNKDIQESRINAALGKAKDIGMKIAKNALASNNNFISTVVGGSKGDFFKIAQITGLLGQQNLSGKRVPFFLNNNTRTIPHYPLKMEDYTVEQKFESRGFIKSSFISGLNPKEFFFHACSGREGMSDTAVGTAISGYISRRIVKLQEDMKVCYDGTVRDETNRIFALQYGEHGYDPTATVQSKKGDQIFMDVGRLASLLNREHEKNI